MSFPGHEDAVMWLCTETCLILNKDVKVKAGVFRLTWLSLTSLREQKLRLHIYACAFIQLYINIYNVHVLSFFNREQHFPLWLVTSSNPHLLSKLCCYSLGLLVMTAFTHNVCALFCKLMVVNVCLLLLYIHYESCFRHSMSLSLSLSSCFAFGPIPLGQKLRRK